MFLAATATGCLRVYKYPFTGEVTEMRCHASSITCMRPFYDESLLFTAGEDGSVFIFDVRQDVKSGVKRDNEKLPFADEVLVAKSDLEEKKSRYFPHQCKAAHTPSSLVVFTYYRA
jgi:hypothetical protein